jgi:hypothetical protein
MVRLCRAIGKAPFTVTCRTFVPDNDTILTETCWNRNPAQFLSVEYPEGGGGGGGLTNSVEDRGQREWGSGSGSPLVRGSTQFANK